jgi:hypothetical protein
MESGTDSPRVENLVITPVNMHLEGSDLIGAFLCLTVFRRGGYSYLFIHLTLPAIDGKVC